MGLALALGATMPRTEHPATAWQLEAWRKKLAEGLAASDHPHCEPRLLKRRTLPSPVALKVCSLSGILYARTGHSDNGRITGEAVRQRFRWGVASMKDASSRLGEAPRVAAHW